MRRMQVINFFGGPGTGKSTSAAGLFYRMKMLGKDVELVTEVAKDYVWSGHLEMFNNQILVTAQQYERIRRLEGKLDFVVTDSPILLGVHYAPEGYFEGYEDLVYQVFNSFDNMNIFVKRTKKYNPIGRTQTECEAIAIDADIKRILNKYDIDFVEMTMEEINKMEIKSWG